MRRVPTLRVRDRQPAHELGQVAVTLRPKHKMPVIRQDAPGKDAGQLGLELLGEALVLLGLG